MKKTARMPIRVILYRDDSDRSIWVAHCLEFDLLGHGESKKSAISCLMESVLIQIKETVKSGNFNNLFTPAPAEYQMMYAQGTDTVDGELKIEIHYDDEFEIEKIDTREYDDGYCDDETDSKLAVAR